MPDTAVTPPSPSPVPGHELTVVDMVWPDQSNHHGTLFGGAGLSILDRNAFILASRVLRGSVVTASVGALNFQAPARVGLLIECQSRVSRIGRRSATIHTQLVAEDLLTGERLDCLSGEFVMVRRDTAAPVLRPCPPEPTRPHSLAKATVAEIVFPGQANHRQVLHGGPAMSWMAKAGFVAATRQTRQPMVMAASERLDFSAPAYVGEVVEADARVLSIGRRSVQVEVQMWAEAPETGQRRQCTTGKLVYVALES